MLWQVFCLSPMFTALEDLLHTTPIIGGGPRIVEIGPPASSMPGASGFESPSNTCLQLRLTTIQLIFKRLKTLKKTSQTQQKKHKQSEAKQFRQALKLCVSPVFWDAETCLFVFVCLFVMFLFLVFLWGTARNTDWTPSLRRTPETPDQWPGPKSHPSSSLGFKLATS